MSINFNKLQDEQNKATSTSNTATGNQTQHNANQGEHIAPMVAQPNTGTPPSNLQPNQKKALTIAFGAVALAVAMFGAYKMGNKNSATEGATVTTTQAQPEEVKAFEPKKVEKLPFDVPKHITGKIVDILDFGNFFLVGTEIEGQTEYVTLSKDGKFTLIGYVIDNKAQTAIYDVNGRISDEDRKASKFQDDNTGAPQSSTDSPTGTADGMPTSATDFEPKSQLGADGLPDSYFTDDLTKDSKHTAKASKVNTFAVGEFKTNPDLFARHLFEQFYKSTINSDTNAGKYKDKPMTPMYVFYDPRCPACQAEMPHVEQARTEGYDVVYVPTGALSSDAQLSQADATLVSRVLNPSKGLEDLLTTLDNSYQRPSDDKGDTNADRSVLINNTNMFKSLPTVLNTYYAGKPTKSFKTIEGLGVPSAFYVDKNTGEVVLTMVDLKSQLGN